jgi:hypothetical protein
VTPPVQGNGQSLTVYLTLIYRLMLSYCIWKAILRAIKGAWVSWGKLERTASVPVRA